MISDILNTIPNGGIFQVIAILIFFPIFVGVSIWVFRINKNYLSKMENLPLEDDTVIENKIGE